jgi:acyl-CoA thioesterase-1
MTRRIILILVAAAVVTALWYLRTTGAPSAAKPIGGTNVIAFGDSLVSGVGASSGRDFVSVLSSRLGVRILNAGRPGDTTASALARLDQAVLARNPRVVIVLLGGNDFLRRVPRDRTFDNLETIVTRIRQRGAAVVLVGVSLGLFTDSYAAQYEALAEHTSAAYVPDVLDGVYGHADRMADQIHPNDRGYAIVADRIEPVLREMLE